MIKFNYLSVFKKIYFTSKFSFMKNNNEIIVFNVIKNCNKLQIYLAVKKIFDIKILKIRTLIVKEVIKNKKKNISYIKKWKKAYVYLKKGEKININNLSKF